MTLTASPSTGTPAAEEHRALRVVLVDGHCIFRQALRILLGAEKDFAVVGEAGRAGEALELIGSLQADLVLTDLHLPDGGAGSSRPRRAPVLGHFPVCATRVVLPNTNFPRITEECPGEVQKKT